MNRHPLTADFNMYYNGTYIFRQGAGGFEAMLVEGTNNPDGADDTVTAGVQLSGHVYNKDKDLGYQTWTGDEILAFRPTSGYYEINGKGRNVYLSFSVSNRTQRKGFDSRNVLANGAPWSPNGRQMVKIFEQAQGLDSRPGARDIYMNGNVVNWKGVHVGDMEGEKFIPLKQFKQFEELVCRLLQSI